VQLERWETIDTKTFPEMNRELKEADAATGIKDRQKRRGKN